MENAKDKKRFAKWLFVAAISHYVSKDVRKHKERGE